jgi:imidazolonepropionase-like amidohydrolase
VCGADAGVGPNKPHDVVRYGVSAFPEFIGMTNVDALRANTSVAADACGVGHRKGTIEIGKDADLLAVAGDPLDDITRIRQILAVFVRGNPVGITH